MPAQHRAAEITASEPLGAPRVNSAPRVNEDFSADEFSATVSAATAMFGDPTRRKIYLFVRESDLGVTAADAAVRFGLHPNVARHHLDKLAAGGFTEGGSDSSAGRTGRPSKRYRAKGAAGSASIEFPARRHDLLVTLLGRALDLIPRDQAERMAEAVGYDYGRDLAAQLNPNESQRSIRSALHTVAEALTAHGFAAHAESRGNVLAIVNDACPFGEMSAQHPVICAVDRGMVRGMLHTLYGPDTSPALAASRARGADSCVTTV